MTLSHVPGDDESETRFAVFAGGTICETFEDFEVVFLGSADVLSLHASLLATAIIMVGTKPSL